MRPEMRMRPALALDWGVSITRSTRTGRRGAAGGGVLQLGRAVHAGAGLGRLLQPGAQPLAGRVAWGGWMLRRLCGLLAVNQPIKPWNEPSKPVGENNAIPIGPPQQAVLNTDETVVVNANERG